MGSSAKRKKEKKKDFEKPKLKVGKSRPKPANATNTSFRAKSIVLNAQSLSSSAPTAAAQFLHSLSLLTSKSDSQRRDALSSLHNALASVQAQRQQAAKQSASTEDGNAAAVPDLPRPASEIISRLRSLLLDASRSIRGLTLECLQCLDADEIASNIELLTIYVHIGLTHLSADIRATAVSTLEWLLAVAGNAVVSSRGGWTGTLGRVVAVLGWNDAGAQPGSDGGPAAKPGAQSQTLPETQRGWTHTTRTKLEDPKLRARHISVLAQLLEAGLRRPAEAQVESAERRRMAAQFPLRDLDAHKIGNTADPFARLNLFVDAEGTGKRQDEDVAIGDAAGRAEVYRKSFGAGVAKGVEEARREGGEVGRAAKSVERLT